MFRGCWKVEFFSIDDFVVDGIFAYLLSHDFIFLSAVVVVENVVESNH